MNLSSERAERLSTLTYPSSIRVYIVVMFYALFYLHSA